MCAKASDTDVTAGIAETAGTVVTDGTAVTAVTAVTDGTAGTAVTDVAAGTAVIDGTVVITERTVRTVAGSAPSGLTTATVIMMTDVKEASAEVIMADTTTTVATMFTAMMTRAFSSIFSQSLSLYAAPTPIILLERKKLLTNAAEELVARWCNLMDVTSIARTTQFHSYNVPSRRQEAFAANAPMKRETTANVLRAANMMMRSVAVMGSAAVVAKTKFLCYVVERNLEGKTSHAHMVKDSGHD